MKHFLDLAVQGRDFVKECLDLAVELKKAPFRTDLAHQTLVMIFEKPSNRTRLSFDIGMQQLGGNTVYLQAQDIGWPDREPMQDLAKVMERYADAVMIRCFSHKHLCEFAKASSKPVINGLTDFSHPCQALADGLTILESFGQLKGVPVTYIGDVNNVLYSLWNLAFLMDFPLTVSCPKTFSESLPTHVRYEEDPLVAAKGAKVIYSDVWVSMGQEAETDKRMTLFKGYQITDAVMQQAEKEAIFLHCLPAQRGVEVSASVIDGPQSKVYDQAENRMHAQKALLLNLL
ncbi:MAG: ornithine carbamoyltransferase [bacterium]